MDLIAPGALTVGEAADYLRVSRSQLYKLMDDGTVPWRKVGASRRIPRAALDRLLDPTTVDVGALDLDDVDRVTVALRADRDAGGIAESERAALGRLVHHFEGRAALARAARELTARPPGPRD